MSGLWQHRNDWIDNLDEPGENDLEGYDDIAFAARSSGSRRDLTLRLTGQYRDLDGDARIFRANAMVAAATIWSASTAAISSATKSAQTEPTQELTTWNSRDNRI